MRSYKQDKDGFAGKKVAEECPAQSKVRDKTLEGSLRRNVLEELAEEICLDITGQGRMSCHDCLGRTSLGKVSQGKCPGTQVLAFQAREISPNSGFPNLGAPFETQGPFAGASPDRRRGIRIS